jgi:hypothetical protein
MQSRLRLGQILAILILLPMQIAVAQSRPTRFGSGDESDLRRGAMAQLRLLIRAFPDSPVAADARRIVAQDEKAANPHAWVAETLGWVDRSLKANPPSAQNAPIRRAILLVVDYPLRVDHSYLKFVPRYDAEWAQAVGRYFQASVAPAIDQIAAAKVDRGLDVWLLYNMGFVVKSPTHCIGFDIHIGSVVDPYPLNDAQQKVLVDRLEVLFVTHWHFDHLNERFVRRMLDAGKKVVLPTPVRTDLRSPSVVRLYDDCRQPTEVCGMKVYCFPGWQRRDTPMGVYAVNMDGAWVLHMGDNGRTEIYREIPARCAVDLLLANCWSGFDACATATRPRLMLIGHQNELSHPGRGRRSFAEMFGYLDRMKNPPPSTILNWGEHTHFGF